MEVSSPENTRKWKVSARSEESADLLGDWIQVDVVETGSGGQTGHGAHLRETPQKQCYLKNKSSFVSSAERSFKQWNVPILKKRKGKHKLVCTVN